MLVVEPLFDFTVDEGEQLTIRCTIEDPESLDNIENGSLALTKGGSNLTRNLGIFELISFYTKVFLFIRNLFKLISTLYTSYLIASSNTKLSVTWHKEISVEDDSGVYTCLYTTYPDPVSVSVYTTVIAQGWMLHIYKFAYKIYLLNVFSNIILSCKIVDSDWLRSI